MVGSPKCLRNSGALEVVREPIPKIAAISFFADLEHKWTWGLEAKYLAKELDTGDDNLS